MTTPDHRPYLLATDLRTPEDVLAAMDAYHPCEEAGDVAFELRARLDRERRQACRRAALIAWRRFANLSRDHKGKWASHFTNAVLYAYDLGSIGKTARESLTRALAFRAAARTP